MTGVFVERVAVTGAGLETAAIDFTDGLNVVAGASDVDPMTLEILRYQLPELLGESLAMASYVLIDTSYLEPGSTHEVSRNASATKPAKFLALIFAKKGLALVTPA